MTDKKYFFILIGIPAILLLSCAAPETPYLLLDVRPVYENRHINVPYEFESENDSQKCRIIVIKKGGREDEIVSDEERWLYKKGDLHFDLENGFYTLQFTVLSLRGGRFYELSFLSEEYPFSIQDSYVEEGT